MTTILCVECQEKFLRCQIWPTLSCNSPRLYCARTQESRVKKSQLQSPIALPSSWTVLPSCLQNKPHENLENIWCLETLMYCEFAPLWTLNETWEAFSGPKVIRIFWMESLSSIYKLEWNAVLKIYLWIDLIRSVNGEQKNNKLFC